MNLQGTSTEKKQQNETENSASPEAPQEIDEKMEQVVLVVEQLVLDQPLQDDALRQQGAVVQDGGHGGGRLTDERRH